MLSLLRENDPSACRAEFGACMRTGVSEDNSRKSNGHFSRYCKALTLRSSAISILVYFCLLNSSLKIGGGGEGEAAQESQVSSLGVGWQNQITRKSQVRSHSGADLTPKLLRYRTKNKNKNKMSADRYFGLALDGSPSSKYALKWAIDNVFKEGDHLILVVVHKEVLEGGQVHLWGKSGSPLVPYASLIDPNIQKAYQLKWDEEILQYLEEAMTVKKLTVVAKVYWGDAKEKICAAVVEIPLDGLIMGSRGFGTFKRTLLGSVSNYVVNNVPCPVTVVKLPGPL